MNQPPHLQALWQKYVSRSPHMAERGMEVSALGPDRGSLRQPTRADQLGDPARQRLHPGVATVLADSACGLAVGAALSERQPYATLDLRMDHLRPALLGPALHSQAHCFRLSRSVAFVRAEVWQQSPDEPVAVAQATFMLGTPAGQRRTRSASVPAEASAMDGVADASAPASRASPASPAASGAPTASAAPAVALAAAARLAEPPPPTGPASGWQPPAESQPVWPAQAMPYAGYLGLRQALADDGAPLYLLPHQDKLIGNPYLPALHGGVLAGMAESAAMLHLLQHTQGQRVPKGIDFAIDYLRAAGPHDCFARCELVRVGARVALVQVRLWQQHKGPAQPVAVARGHYLLGAAGSGAEEGSAA